MTGRNCETVDFATFGGDSFIQSPGLTGGLEAVEARVGEGDGDGIERRKKRQVDTGRFSG